MLAPGDYSDTLRALGRFLEEIRALNVRIQDRELHLQLTWTDRHGHRMDKRYQPQDVWALRKAAAMHRGIENSMHRFSPAELLRTLGRDLDEMKATNVSIREDAEGFSVKASVKGGEMSRTYGYADLVARAQQYHEMRLAEQQVTDAPESAQVLAPQADEAC